MIRNLQADPYSRGVAKYRPNSTFTADPADGRQIYACADASQKLFVFSVLQSATLDRYGRTLVSVIEFGKPVTLAGTTLLRMSSADSVTIHRISDTRYWISGCLKRSGSQWHELQFEPAIDTTVKLLGSALYTPEDWEFVKELVSTGVLEIPWFAVPALRPDDGREPQPVLMP